MSSTDTASETEDEVTVMTSVILGASGTSRSSETLEASEASRSSKASKALEASEASKALEASEASKDSDASKASARQKIELFQDFLSGRKFQKFLTYSKLQIGIAKREALELGISHRVYLGFYDAIHAIARETASGKRIFDSDNFDELVKLIKFFDSDVNAPPVTDPPTTRSPYFNAAQNQFELNQSTNNDQSTLKILKSHLDSFIWSLKGEAKGRGENFIGIPEIAALYKYTSQFHLPKYVHFIKTLFSNLLTPFSPNQPRMNFQDGTGALDFAKSSRCFLCTRPKDREKIFKTRYLNAHLKKTHKFELYICPDCPHPHVFYRRQTLRKHTNTYHSTDPNQVHKVLKRQKLKQKSKTNYRIPRSSNSQESLTQLPQIHCQDHLPNTATAPPPESDIHVMGNKIFDNQDLLITIGDPNHQPHQDILTEKASSSSSPPPPPPPAQTEPNHVQALLLDEADEEFNELLELLEVDPEKFTELKAESERTAEQLIKDTFIDSNDSDTTTVSTLAPPPLPQDPDRALSSPLNFYDVPESIQGQDINIIISPNTFMDSDLNNQVEELTREKATMTFQQQLQESIKQYQQLLQERLMILERNSTTSIEQKTD